jgi:adenylate kinase
VGQAHRWRAMLLFGVPGSGKGTQGRALGCLPGLIHISSGEIFRQLYKAGPLGKEVDRYTSAGKLVPDDLTVNIFFNHMDLLTRKGEFDPKSHVIIADGIPRTYEQAKILNDRIEVVKIFNLKLQDEEEAIERIKQRALRENRRDDANDTIIRSRFETFHRQTADVLRFYDENLVLEMNASDNPLLVLADLAREIGSFLTEPSSIKQQVR